MICTLISGCGLFRKKTKTVSRQQVDLVQQSQSKIYLSGKTHENRKITTQLDISRNSDESMFIEADEINVDKDGNISAIGAKLTHNKKANETDKSKKQEESETKTIVALTADSSGRKEFESKDVATETKTDSSPKGIIFGTIALIAFCFSIFWYFGVKRKRFGG